MARTGKPAVRQIESVQRAISVLNVLAEAGADLGTNEIARQTGVNISTVSRLLATLVDGGLLQYVPSTGKYRLGIRILQLASVARENLQLRDVVRPHLEEITAITGETATLSLPGERDVFTVDFVASDSSVRSVASIGRNSVPHATAVGKVFLAHGGTTSGELTAYTDHTITDRAALDAEVARVKEQGWATAVREREPELSGVGVPVLDGSGALAAILGVQGPATRFTDDAMRAAVDLLWERAAVIGSVL
ncbi:IclR family transcriptional regulator [Haloechinothrix salitolerans]|uniref:IclR family transcriptional regulator n=1 Tax=Haloechinothrix salitolerans TaxID=926830 RepID=A0ABW2BYS9_9PSEU